MWGNTSEFYRMNGNRRISDAVIIVVDMPEDKDFQEMRELARYFFEDMEQIVQKKQKKKDGPERRSIRNGGCGNAQALHCWL